MPSGIYPRTPERHVTAQVRAEYESDEFFFEIYGFEEKPLKCLHCEFRGDGDPLPWLYRLCHPNRWSAVADCDGSFVEFGKNGASRWRFFRYWARFVTRRKRELQDGSN